MATKDSKNQALIRQLNARSKGVHMIIECEDGEKIAKLQIQFKSSLEHEGYWVNRWGWLKTQIEMRSRNAMHVRDDFFEFKNGLVEIVFFFDKYDDKLVKATLTWLATEAFFLPKQFYR